MTKTYGDTMANPDTTVVFETRKTGYLVRGRVGVEALKMIAPTLISFGRGEKAEIFVEPFQFESFRRALEAAHYSVQIRD